MKTLAEIEKIKQENILLCAFGLADIYRKAWDDLMPLMLEREKELIDAAECVTCECSVKERLSGHLTGCYLPELREAMEKLK